MKQLKKRPTIRTAEYVNITEVLKHLGFTQDQQEYILGYGFSNVSWGDSEYTLVGNNFARECFLDGVELLSKFEADAGKNTSYDYDVLENKWLDLVGPHVYINMEA